MTQETTEDYLLWLAQEALRQAEKCITAQQTQLTWVQGRATSTLGWVSAEVLGTLGLVGANLSKGLHNPTTVHWLIFGCSVFVPAAISTFYLSRVLPRMEWCFEGLNALNLLKSTGITSKEEMLHSMISGLAAAQQQNDTTIHRMVRNLRIGWWWFLCTPLVAILSAILLVILTT